MFTLLLVLDGKLEWNWILWIYLAGSNMGINYPHFMVIWIELDGGRENLDSVMYVFVLGCIMVNQLVRLWKDFEKWGTLKIRGMFVFVTWNVIIPRHFFFLSEQFMNNNYYDTWFSLSTRKLTMGRNHTKFKKISTKTSLLYE